MALFKVADKFKDGRQIKVSNKSIKPMTKDVAVAEHNGN